MVILDTCVLSEHLRRNVSAPSGHALEVRRLAAAGQAVVIGTVHQEILSGIRIPAQFESALIALQATVFLACERSDYETAARFSNACRAAGVQGSLADFLICAVAARTRYPIYTVDKDFTRYAIHLPITLHRPT